MSRALQSNAYKYTVDRIAVLPLLLMQAEMPQDEIKGQYDRKKFASSIIQGWLVIVVSPFTPIHACCGIFLVFYCTSYTFSVYSSYVLQTARNGRQ